VVSLSGFVSASERRIKRLVGAIAVGLIVLFTVVAYITLFLTGTFPFLDWLIGVLIVALIANLIFRRVGKQTRRVK
jgi:cobalamin biosynthesis protein CobD/CbiB